MYLADNTVTVVKFDRAEQTYSGTAICGVSWASKQVRSMNNTAASVSTQTTVRIPEDIMPDGLIIKTGDFICRGEVSNINRREDMEQYERFCVTEVRDNRRGTHLRHWAVIGA